MFPCRRCGTPPTQCINTCTNNTLVTLVVEMVLMMILVQHHARVCVDVNRHRVPPIYHNVLTDSAM